MRTRPDIYTVGTRTVQAEPRPSHKNRPGVLFEPFQEPTPLSLTQKQRQESTGEMGGEANAEQALEALFDVGVEQAEYLIDRIEIDMAHQEFST